MGIVLARMQYGPERVTTRRRDLRQMAASAEQDDGTHRALGEDDPPCPVGRLCSRPDPLDYRGREDRREA